jgi:hypothetical protein
MATRKISQLTQADTLTGTEQVEINQGGSSRRTTTKNIADLNAQESADMTGSEILDALEEVALTDLILKDDFITPRIEVDSVKLPYIGELNWAISGDPSLVDYNDQAFVVSHDGFNHPGSMKIPADAVGQFQQVRLSAGASAVVGQCANLKSYEAIVYLQNTPSIIIEVTPGAFLGFVLQFFRHSSGVWAITTFAGETLTAVNASNNTWYKLKVTRSDGGIYRFYIDDVIVHTYTDDINEVGEPVDPSFYVTGPAGILSVDLVILKLTGLQR